MLSLIGSVVRGVSFLLLSGYIVGYSSEYVYRYIQKQALLKISQGLPSMSEMSRILTCKEFNKEMMLVPYRKGVCKQVRKQ